MDTWYTSSPFQRSIDLTAYRPNGRFGITGRHESRSPFAARRRRRRPRFRAQPRDRHAARTQFPLVWIGGEISNFTRAATGHWYFTLKDDAAQVRAVMFRGRAQYAGFTPREGDKVEVRALVTLYGRAATTRLNVEAIRRAGVGALFEAFLRLKEQLEAQGLFDPRAQARAARASRARSASSPVAQAAALRDVLTALRGARRTCRSSLYPAPVQGAGRGAKDRREHRRRVARRRSRCAAGVPRRRLDRRPVVLQRGSAWRARSPAARMPVIERRRPRDRLHHRRFRRRLRARHADRRRRARRPRAPDWLARSISARDARARLRPR